MFHVKAGGGTAPEAPCLRLPASRQGAPSRSLAGEQRSRKLRRVDNKNNKANGHITLSTLFYIRPSFQEKKSIGSGSPAFKSYFFFSFSRFLIVRLALFPFY